MMNQKKIDLLKKLKNLAEQGVGGEKETAQKKLKQLMKKYNVEEEELSDDTEEKYEFTFHGEFEKRLLLQVGYKILGKKIKKKMYEYKKGAGKRTTRIIECTKAEALQIRIEHEFYCDLWKEEQDFFFECFIQKHRIFAEDNEEKTGKNRKMTREEEVYLFRMEDECAQTLIDGVYREYGKLLETAARTFKDTNGRKFKYKVDTIKAGDEEFQKQFKEVIAKNIKDYMENEYATYVEYAGEELAEESVKSPKTSDDFVNIRKDIFEMVGQAFKIPMSMMMGNITNLKEVCDVFLTFGVNPLANTISEVLNKRATVYEYMNGNYYQCYTGGIKHRDLFETAANAEKLIGSAIINTDEAREELSLVPLNTPWSKTYYVTNNFREADDARTAVKGGEEDE